MKLLEMILSEMINVSKPQKKFFTTLMKIIVAAHGKINFRSLSRYSGLSEKSFRRWFRKIFDFGEFNSLAIDRVVTQESDKESLHYHYNASFSALNLVKIQEQLDRSDHETKEPFSMARYMARFYNESMINRFFSKLAPGIVLEKSSPIFREAINYGAIIFRYG